MRIFCAWTGQDFASFEQGLKPLFLPQLFSLTVKDMAKKKFQSLYAATVNTDSSLLKMVKSLRAEFLEKSCVKQILIHLFLCLEVPELIWVSTNLKVKNDKYKAP